MRRAPRDPGGSGRRWVAVAWAPYSRRSEMFARELGGALHCIHYLRFRSPPYAPVKYPMQAVATLRMLFRERPDAVHVQTPPFLCGLVVWLYCRITGARYVIEYHSAAFDPAWTFAMPVQRWVARRAAVNIVTNEHWSRVVSGWGARTLVMYDAFLDLPEGRPYRLRDGVNLAFLCVFAPDEPVREVLEAARRNPGVHVHVTGDTGKAPAGLVAAAPPNVTFTGFLDPNGEYVGLLRAVDGAIVLTTRDHTLQLAGCEAVALGKPIVTSDFEYLHELFADAAVYATNTAEGIGRAIADLVARREELARNAVRVREVRREEWRRRMDQLEELVAGAGAGRHREEGSLAGRATRERSPE